MKNGPDRSDGNDRDRSHVASAPASDGPARRAAVAMATSLLVVILASLWVEQGLQRHVHFAWEAYLGFYVWLSLGVSALLVVVAHAAAWVLMRSDEDQDEYTCTG